MNTPAPELPTAAASQALNPNAQARIAKAQHVDIDALDVSDRWKKYFHNLRVAGGPFMPLLKTMDKNQRAQVMKDARPPVVSFVLAFIFSVFYYAFKGMWKKGLVLLAIVLPIAIVLSTVLILLGMEWAVRGVQMAAAFTFGTMAPMDFYAKKVLGDDGWLPVKPW